MQKHVQKNTGKIASLSRKLMGGHDSAQRWTLNIKFYCLKTSEQLILRSDSKCLVSELLKIFLPAK